MGQNVIGWLQAYDPEKNQADWKYYVIGFSSSDGQPLLVESFMNLDSDELDSYLVPEEVLPDESKVDNGESKEEDLFVGGQPGEEEKLRIHYRNTKMMAFQIVSVSQTSSVMNLL